MERSGAPSTACLRRCIPATSFSASAAAGSDSAKADVPSIAGTRLHYRLVITRESSGKNDEEPSFTVVQVPHLSTPVQNSKHVKGKYVSVERVRKVVGEDGKAKVEWM